MTIFRTRYGDPNERRWVNEWAETRVAAELCRSEIEKRFSPRKLEVHIERFELNAVSERTRGGVTDDGHQRRLSAGAEFQRPGGRQ